jgi:hypothetical protein
MGYVVGYGRFRPPVAGQKKLGAYTPALSATGGRWDGLIEEGFLTSRTSLGVRVFFWGRLANLKFGHYITHDTDRSASEE